MLPELICELLRGKNHLLVDSNKTSPVEQRPPDLKGRSIEGSVRDLGYSVRGVQDCVIGAQHEAIYGAMRYRHSLRLPR